MIYQRNLLNTTRAISATRRYYYLSRPTKIQSLLFQGKISPYLLTRQLALLQVYQTYRLKPKVFWKNPRHGLYIPTCGFYRVRSHSEST